MSGRAWANAVALVTAGGAVACLVLGARADPTPATATLAANEAQPVLSTPMVAARRVPGLFTPSIERAISRTRLQGLLTGLVAPLDACVAVEAGGQPIAQVNADRPLAGASTQKLLIAAAALESLGASHRFVTTAVSPAPLHSGELAGDLVIVGSGDPVLTSATAPDPGATRLSDLADAIVRAGVRRVDGSLVADDLAFDRSRSVDAWKPNEISEGDVGALGALIVDGGRGDNGLAASDPALVTVQKLAPMLAARGVSIGRGVRDGAQPAPAGAREIARVESPPLADIVSAMLTFSNDETAEELTRAIGATQGSGTTAAGTAAAEAILARLGIPVRGVDLHDGSGLAPSDRVTCPALLQVLALGRRPRFAAIDRGLAVAAHSGTLAARFVGTPLAGRLRGKTGSIDGVAGLAATIDPVPPDPAPRRDFAFVVNGSFSPALGDALVSEIATVVATYPDVHGAAVVPAP